jgi:Cu/Ag efflux protein CusF
LHAKTETIPLRRLQILWTFAVPLAILLVVLSGCSKPAAPTPEKHYTLTGKVVSVNAKEQTASIDHEPIKGWMDEAMTMDYPIRSKAEFDQLHPGDRISATVNVRGLDYDLTDIRKLQPAP